MKNIISIFLVFISVHMGAQNLSLCNITITNISVSGQVGFEAGGPDFSGACITITGTADLCNEDGEVIGEGLVLTLESKGCKGKRIGSSGMSKDKVFMPFELMGDAPEFEGTEIPFVFPNPSKGLYTLKTKKDNLENMITLVSITSGKQLNNVTITKSDKGYLIDLTSYPSGMYLLQYDIDNQKFSQKIIKK